MRTVDEAVARLRAVDAQLQAFVTLEPLHTRVQTLRCFRGMDDLTALTIAAELGDPPVLTRVLRARQLPTNHGHAVPNPRISE